MILYQYQLSLKYHKEASVSSIPTMLDFLKDMIKMTGPAQKVEKTEKTPEEQTKKEKKVENPRKEEGMKESKKEEAKRRAELMDHLNHLYLVD